MMIRQLLPGLVSLLAFLWGGTIQAATFTVTKTADTADGLCNTDCSLREAVIAANAAGGANTITLPAGTYTLSLVGPCSEDAAGSGDLDVINGATGNNLTINGSTTGATIIDGNGTDRVFHIPAITVASTLTLNNLTVRNGRANACTPNAGLGGGLRTDQGNIALNRVTVSGNTAVNAGGGAHVGNGRLTAINSTFSGNEAENGGGVSVRDFGGVALRNATVSDNTASVDGGGVYVEALSTAPLQLTIRNTIIAGNHDTSPAGNDFPDCALNDPPFAQLATEGFNLIGDETGCDGEFGGNDQFGNGASPLNPQLGPLANNGGPTFTHLLLAGSSAIDRANTAGCFSNDANNGSLLTVDQRSFARPLDGDGDANVRCDVGAVEVGCGNGFVELNESCDDGNNVDGDGCNALCVLESCGDGVVQPSEGCDDGNNVDGDGCSAACVLESCGDGVTQPAEACDDGNAINTDACLNICQDASCGDGFVQTGVEECDDGNTAGNDGCSATCTVETTGLVLLLGDGGCSLIR